VAREENGMLVPCSAAGLPDAAPEDGRQFLLTEYAGALVSDDPADAFAAGRYANGLRTWPEDDSDVRRVFALLVEEIGDDRDRWLEVAVAIYGSSPLVRGGVHALLADPPPAIMRSDQVLAALVFDRIRGPDVHERLIDAAFRHLPDNSWGVMCLLSEYSRDPRVVERVRAIFDADDPMGLRVAGSLVRDADHPLREPAATAALRMLPDIPTPVRPRLDSLDYASEAWVQYGQSHELLYAACNLLFRYGDDAQWQVVLAQVREAETADPVRFSELYRACTDSGKSDRLIDLAKIGIDDRRLAWPDAPEREGRSPLRFCDLAWSAICQATDLDFGINWRDGTTDEETELGIERARQWLVEKTDYVAPAP